jgi:glycine cleavage system aminomethyltransferase T
MVNNRDIDGVAPVSRQRTAYEQVVANRGGGFGIARPAYFSPAIAAQDLGGNGTYGHFAQMLLVQEYTSWVEESGSHTTSCYIGDWSPLNKVRVSGPEALSFLDWLGMNDLSDFALRQIKHSVQLDSSGFVASEGILLRLGEQDFLYTAGSGDWLQWQLAQGTWRAAAKDISPDSFIFGVQGTPSIVILEAVADESLRDIEFNRSKVVTIEGAPVRVLRTGISGELGYELHGPSDAGNEIWSAVVTAGAASGIRQLGFRSQSVQHIEAGIATNGLDYLPSSILGPGAPTQFRQRPVGGSFVPTAVVDFFRKPGELGWGGRLVRDHDFLGRDALAADAASGGPARTLVGLTWNSDDVASVMASGARPGDRVEAMDLPRYNGMSLDDVRVGDESVGVSSGRTLSQTLSGTISLCVLDRRFAEPGTEVIVMWGRPGTSQRGVRATVNLLPFKPDRRRIDVTAI